MNLASVVYLPPSRMVGTDAFKQNLAQFKTHYPIYTYSDCDDSAEWKVGNPEVARHPRMPWAVNNAVFLYGLNVAVDAGLDYFLYLEHDCRVRMDYWDRVLFAEATDLDAMIVAGTPVFWWIPNGGNKFLKRATEWAHLYQSGSGMGVPMYGHREQARPCIYPNGAGGIYHTQTILKYCPQETRMNVPQSAQRMRAWDMQIGDGLWGEFGADVLDRFTPILSQYSGYGEMVTTESERQQMLTSGDKVLVHQIKSTWKP